MASIATPLQVDEGLESSFKSATEGGSIRFLQVQVKEERLVLVTSQADSGDLQSDFNAIPTAANEEEASYFIFKLKPREWIIITYVPEKVPIKEKMVYASAKGTLKDKFGHSLFVEELHATAKDELTYEHFQGTKAPADARSTLEIERERILEEENDARNEIEQQQTAKREAQTSGGYHSVTIPLAASAKTALDRLKSGEINFVGLAVDESQSSVIGTDAKNVDTSRISSEIHTGEPRFYLFSQTGRTVFIYSCPTRSPPKLRMTYSTTKPNVVNQVTQYGINLAPKKVEITDPEDLVDELKDAQTSRPVNTSFRGNFTGRMIAPAPGSTPALGGTVKASNLPTMSNQHSIYGLMARPGTEQPTTKKKIVIPPRAAWNG